MVEDEPATDDFPIDDVRLDAPLDDDMPTLTTEPETPPEETAGDGEQRPLDDVLPPEPEPIPNVFSPGLSEQGSRARKKKGSGKAKLLFFVVLLLIAGIAAAAWIFRQQVQDMFPSTTERYNLLIEKLGLPPEYPGAGLELDCPPDKITRDADSEGNETATAVCTATNITDRPVEFPSVRIRLTNLNGTIIHKEAIIPPPQPTVAPGETVVFSPTVDGVGRSLRMDVDFIKTE
jgi:hypothetical protein